VLFTQVKTFVCVVHRVGNLALSQKHAQTFLS